MVNDRKGLLIVFEGTDGTGKSTQLQLLKKYLSAGRLSVTTTCEPTHGPFGIKIRELYHNRHKCSPEEELELFMADRRQHVSELINPALQRGEIILCDRYFLSTAAYQGAAGFDPETILKRNDFAPEPDLALLFHTPLAVGSKRIVSGRGDTLNDFEQLDFLKKVAIIFSTINRPYIRRIDGTGAIKTVQDRVLKHVLPLISHFHNQKRVMPNEI